MGVTSEGPSYAETQRGRGPPTVSYASPLYLYRSCMAS
jgi:hypothetical protein